MGSVFGKQSVAEPAFEVLYKQQQGFQYEVRRYGQRFFAEASYGVGGDSPFPSLARYIGVFGRPENEGKTAISMTAPVVMDRTPTSISMTAPVVMAGSSKHGVGKKKMQFMLPGEYDSLAKVPKPTNPRVSIGELPAQVGAVHAYAGTYDEGLSREKAGQLASQLQQDGVEVTTDYVMENFQLWAYNGPMTLPMFRRNEVWVSLSPEQVQVLTGTPATN